MLKNPRFLLSTLTEFPNLKDPQGRHLPEIALAGRSNVGKSSLINHLLNHRIAKSSSTPGKTQLLNFFSIDDKMVFVDLPGYGYAKAPLEAVNKWSEAIDNYLNHRPQLRLVLLLVDSRREVSEEDLSLAGWAQEKKIPLLVILTKTDKLSSAELKTQMQKAKDALGFEAISYSVHTAASRPYLEKRILNSL